MLASSFSFSLMGVCVRFSSQTLAPMEIVFFRSAIGLVLLVPLMIIQKSSLYAKPYWLFMTRSLTGFIALCCYFKAISMIPLATAVMLNYTAPLFVALFAPLLLKERFDFLTLFLIVMGFLGVGLIVGPESGVSFQGALSGLFSGIFAGFAYLSISALRRQHASLTIVFYFTVLSTILSFPMAFLEFKWPQGIEVLYLGGVGLFATIAQILMTRAYRYGRSASISAYASFIVVFSLVWGMLFWAEIPAFWAILGGGLVVLSVILIVKREKKIVSSDEV